MMQYDTLFNNPYERRRITYSHVWWDDAFSNDELKLIEEMCEEQSLEEGTLVGKDNDDETRKIRKSKIKFFYKDAKNGFVFERLNYVAQSLNNQFYNFNLNGYDSFQYTVYDGEEEGKYAWHMDTIMDGDVGTMQSKETRKLTLILLLSDPDVDFKGGELQLNLGREDIAKTIEMPKGRIVAFPSFMIHQVKPVLSGIRKSIVVWVEGPKFI